MGLPIIDVPPKTGDPLDSHVAELTELYGPEVHPYAGKHHARYVEPDVPLHIISRTFQGRHLLRPCRALNEIIVGVLGRALEVHPDIVLYAVAFLSNHMHAQLRGPPDRVAAFVGYVKSEICRRWVGRPDVPWSESLWAPGYLATALPTPDSQIRCLRYILQQSVKEGLVARAVQWPGVHSAGALLRDGVLHGEWLDSTAWARARDTERRRKRPRPVRKADFCRTYAVRLAPIEPWAHLHEEARRREVRAMLGDIEEEARRERRAAGRKVLGAKAVRSMPFHSRSALPPQPWFENRRRMICWADPKAPQTRAYLARYWAFQDAFRVAADALRAGHVAVEFPPGAFRPVTFHRGADPPL